MAVFAAASGAHHPSATIEAFAGEPTNCASTGLGLQTVAIEGGDRSGAMIMSVDPEGPGAKAGIHQGDIVIAWNGGRSEMSTTLRALGPDSVGRTVTLGLRRAGDEAGSGDHHREGCRLSERPRESRSG